MSEATASDAHCTGCGQPVSACSGCGRPLDPPRYCPTCGRRLTVAVSPAGFRARCRDHGELAQKPDTDPLPWSAPTP